jgi:nucleotide-binding universal stress UspA family protein
MKNILVPIEDHHGIASVLRTAQLTAERFSSRIEGVPLGPDFDALIAANYAIPLPVDDRRLREDLETQLHQIFSDFWQASAGAAIDREAIAWNGDDLITDSKIGSIARVFDLIVLGRPGAGAGDPRRATLEAVLFDSGRPILIAPPEPPASLGDVIVIAWNGSAETARTISFAMPFLEKARKVVVLAVAGAMTPGPAGDLLARALDHHGLPVSLTVVDDPRQPAGHTILDHSAALGADLLIKGGYTQSRLRQMIFGGSTSQILADARLPVFMAH